MKRTIGLLLFVAVLSSGALAIAGDTSTRSDQCSISCPTGPVCNAGSCGACGSCK